MAFSLDKLKEFDFEKFQEELQNFDGDDLKRIGTASVGIRALLIIIALIIVIAGGYKLLIAPKLQELDKAIAQEGTLRTDFDAQQKKAANLEAYKDQLAEMERSFGAMLRQLPDKTDVQNLVVDLSQTGARTES